MKVYSPKNLFLCIDTIFDGILKFTIKKKYSKENSLKNLDNNWDFKTELSGNCGIALKGPFEVVVFFLIFKWLIHWTEYLWLVTLLHVRWNLKWCYLNTFLFKKLCTYSFFISRYAGLQMLNFRLKFIWDLTKYRSHPFHENRFSGQFCWKILKTQGSTWTVMNRIKLPLIC